MIESFGLENLGRGSGCTVDGWIFVQGVLGGGGPGGGAASDGLAGRFTLAHPGLLRLAPDCYEPAESVWLHRAANGCIDEVLTLLPTAGLARQHGLPAVQAFIRPEVYLRLVEASAAGRFSWGSE
ncbi:MAG: hypothetical protein O2855_08220 [Planctomycetota bacterium]|nr:hypothetical protein [Planctomycetota bacterium]